MILTQQGIVSFDGNWLNRDHFNTNKISDGIYQLNLREALWNTVEKSQMELILFSPVSRFDPFAPGSRVIYPR